MAYKTFDSTPKRKKIDEEFVSGGRQSPLQKAKKKIAEKKKTTKGKKILAKMAPKKKEGWYPGKYIKKIRKGRKERGKWYLGKYTFDKPKESDTAAGRKSIADRKSAAEAKKSAAAAKKLSAQEKADRVAAPKGKKRLTVKQKDKEGKLKEVTYHKYKKESKTAKDFRSAFKSNCAGKGAGDTFSWNNKSYSCARASDKKKTKSKSLSSHQKYEDTKKKYS
jgi:hypothetical protein